ncbi:MAG: hypothetical protein AMXMBFR64_29330 [Myxococcales bacterium]
MPLATWTAFVWFEPSAAAQACDPARIHCTNATVYPVWQWDFTAVGGRVYTIRSSDLARLSGQANIPDTVMWLLNLDTGAVVAVDDDDNTSTVCGNPQTDWDCYDSQIVHLAATTFNARVVVAGYADANHGTMSMSVLEGLGTELLPPALRQLQKFGGWRLVSKDVRAGDSLLAGALPGTYYANRMLVFSTSAPYDCDQSCGSYQDQANSALLGLSHVLMTSSWSSARIQIGSATPYTTGVRFMHNRRSSTQGGAWSGAGTVDAEPDGLTWELEALLGTCDTETGPAPDCTTCTNGFPGNCPAGSCRCFRDRAGFDPSDTDNDGVDDLTEVFGREVSCEPLDAPFFMRLTSGGGDKCHDTTLIECAPGQSCNSTFAIALSALAADPREVDAFVELDAIALPGDDGFLNQWERDLVEHIHAEEGFECEQNVSTDPQHCPGELDRYRRVKVHVFDSDLRTSVKINKSWTGFVAGWYAKHFSSWRRYTNAFRYALATTASDAGQGSPKGRWLIFGSVGDSAKTAVVFSHELAHTLGLHHGGNEGAPKINYPSLMNHNKWYTTFTRKAPDPSLVPNSGQIWPPDFGLPCTTAQDCPVSGRCHPDTQTCHVKCWSGYYRFSRGTNMSLVETNLQELGVDQKLAAEVVCQMDAAPNVNPFDATCNGVPYCKVNWDQGENPPGTPEYANGPSPGVDLKKDGVLSSSPFNDYDDWQGIYDNAGAGVDDDCCDKTYTWLGQMEGDASDLAGGDEHGTTVGSVHFTASGVSSYDAAFGLSADLDGPGFSDAIVLPNTPLQSSIAEKFAGRGANGVVFHAFVNLRSVSFTGAHQLIDARPFLDVYVTNGGGHGTLTATLHTGAAPVSVTVANRSGWMFPDKWYWVLVWWDHAELRAYVAPWAVDGAGTWAWRFSLGACSTSSAAHVADSSTGIIRLGAHRDTPLTHALRGRIDEVALMNHAPDEVGGMIGGVSCD